MVVAGSAWAGGHAHATAMGGGEHTLKGLAHGSGVGAAPMSSATW
jgi:hypothetical protein